MLKDSKLLNNILVLLFMNFDFLNPLNNLPFKLLEYSRDDFIDEEFEIIKSFCEPVSTWIKDVNRGFLFEDKIPRRLNLLLQGSFEKGFNALKEKKLTKDDGLRFKAYLYYENYITKELKYTNLFCKLIQLIIQNEAEITNPNTIFFPFIRKFFRRSLLETGFLTYLFNDLGFIQISFGLPEGVRKDYRYYERLQVHEITNKGKSFYRDICPIQNFRELASYIKKLKDEYFFEDYSNIRVRIVAFNRTSTDKFSNVYSNLEILYFRLDFTLENERVNDPKYSHPDQQLILFEEIIGFRELINRMKVEGSILIYNSGEFKFEFIYFIKFPFSFHMFKDNVKPTYHIQRIACEDQLSFVYFELLKQEIFDFNYDEVLRIEFKEEESNKLRNSTEIINKFIGHNLNSLSAPFIIITYPIKSFKTITLLSKEDSEDKIKVAWIVNPRYENFFRCKVLIKGDYYEIPEEGLEIPIEDDSPSSFSYIVQWNGRSDLAQLNETLVKLSIENPHYKPKPLKYYKGFKLDGIPEQASNQLFDKFFKKFLRIIDLIESYQTLKNLIRTGDYKEVDFRDFFKIHFDADENWNVIDEFKGKLDRKNDMRVTSSKHPLFRVSTEFKIWKRNFDKYEPVQELLDNMGNLDKKGVIFMVNSNKSQINEKLKDELIYNHQKYISDTFEEIKVEDRLFPIYKASYEYKNQSIEVYHIIFNLKAFFREDD